MRIDGINSSLLESIDYEEEGQVMRVTFKNGERYDYFFVPVEKVLELKKLCETPNSESIGVWFASKVRKEYIYKRVKKEVKPK